MTPQDLEISQDTGLVENGNIYIKMKNLKELKQKLKWQLRAGVINEDHFNAEMHRLYMIEDAAIKC